MKIFQTDNNAIHYTKEQLKCSTCLKYYSNVVEVKKYPENLFCWDCYNKVFPSFFTSTNQNNEYVFIREIVDIFFRKRKSSKKKERSKLTLKLRYLTLKKNGFSCAVCGAYGKDIQLEIDHILPISKGGLTNLSNLQTLCFKCNRGKSDD